MQLSHHRSLTLRTTERSRHEQGYILVMFALLLVPLLLMAGFAVDVGYWYNRAADMRRAADAAALAGVVWLPDEDAARTAALAAAAKNGYTPSANVSITVTPSLRSERRLKVTITDNRVGSFLYKPLGGKNIDLTRTSYAEYVLAVPLGSPRNFFGTGTLFNTYTGTGMPTEYLYQSVNPYCTDKINGDRYQSGYFNYENTSGSNGTCTGTANAEYRDEGYGMYIEVPTGRTAPIEVRLYDARYNPDDLSWQEQGADDCQEVPVYSPASPSWTGPSGSSATVEIWGPAEYQFRSSTTGSWRTTRTLAEGSSYSRDGRLVRYRTATTLDSSWTTYSSSSFVTINGPAVYQTRPNTGTSWNSITTTTWLPQGSSYTYRGYRLRWKGATVNTTTVCTPTYITRTEAAIDDKRQNGDEDFTYELYAADNTPLDDSDNPLMCSRTFTKDTAFEYDYLGSKRWNTLCTIPTTTLPGRYLVRVRNSGAISSPLNDGSNQWGIVAKYQTGGDGLCDGRTDTMCPRVFGRDAISVRAAATTSVASFYLAEIDPEHAGKKLRLELFDPGEGGSTIEIMRPTGTNGNTWTPATFSWTGAARSGATSGTNVSSIDVTSSRFNGRTIQITVDLSGYSPPSNNRWWQIRYTFGDGEVTDRTTWSARIIGDPVHLVEEN
ncbi:MAG: pilus assembly protein TadG-related protein [Acidimicrobiales bacterium]